MTKKKQRNHLAKWLRECNWPWGLSHFLAKSLSKENEALLKKLKEKYHMEYSHSISHWEGDREYHMGYSEVWNCPDNGFHVMAGVFGFTYHEGTDPSTDPVEDLYN